MLGVMYTCRPFSLLYLSASFLAYWCIFVNSWLTLSFVDIYVTSTLGTTSFSVVS